MKTNVARISTLSALAGLAVVLSIPLLLGCDSIFGHGDCTQLTCNDGVKVQFSGTVPDEFEVGLTLPGGEERVIPCSPGRCVHGAFFDDVTAREVVLQVRWEQGTVTRAVQLEYNRVRPNGPRCDPVCLIAEVEVEF